MKSKFCAAAALIVLLCLSPLYAFWKASVTVYTDAAAGVPVILRYTVAGERAARAKTAQTDANGAVFFSVEPFFSVRRKNILSLRLETSAKVREIRFKGKSKTILKARDDLTFDTSDLKLRLKFNLYKFIMCAASIGYFLFFLSLPRQDESGAKPSKMLNLEFLRCVFCCEIVYQHIAEQLSLPTRSSLAVEFFFILSGYFFKKNQGVSAAFPVRQFDCGMFVQECGRFLGGYFLFQRFLFTVHRLQRAAVVSCLSALDNAVFCADSAIVREKNGGFSFNRFHIERHFRFFQRRRQLCAGRRPSCDGRIDARGGGHGRRYVCMLFFGKIKGVQIKARVGDVVGIFGVFRSDYRNARLWYQSCDDFLFVRRACIAVCAQRGAAVALF